MGKDNYFADFFNKNNQQNQFLTRRQKDNSKKKYKNNAVRNKHQNASRKSN